MDLLALWTTLVQKLSGKDAEKWYAAITAFLRKENPWEAVAKVVGDVVKHLLDLDADPHCPNGLTVAKDGHRKMGKDIPLERRGEDLYLGGKKLVFHLSERQMNGKTIQGFELREELAGKEVLNANVLDYLLAHQELIPESWKRDECGNVRFIYFWGTVYRVSHGYLYVRCLFWHDVGWHRHDSWLGYDWPSHEPAVLAS